MVPPMVPWQFWPRKLVQPWSIGMHSASTPLPAACARLLRVTSTSRLKRVRPFFSQAPLSKQRLHKPPMLPWGKLMTHTFRDLVVGGVLLAPFVTYALAALVIVLIIRPVLRFTRFANMFSHASIAELSVYVTILGLLILCI